MADFTGKVQFFAVFRCPAQHEAEADRFFADHATWMERTHPETGDSALLQYTLAKRRDDEGNVLFLLAEVYESAAGTDNHHRLAVEDGDILRRYAALVEKCETIRSDGPADVVHSLW